MERSSIRPRVGVIITQETQSHYHLDKGMSYVYIEQKSSERLEDI